MVWGGSQGGALSIVTAALDPRVKLLLAVETGHNQTPEQLKRTAQWLEKVAKTGEPGL